MSRLKQIEDLVLSIADEARDEAPDEAESDLTRRRDWPIECTVGPGLEGAIACQSSVGYVNGSQGRLIYRGYDIFDLCAHSCFEEVAYLLLHGRLPTAEQLQTFKKWLMLYRNVPETLRMLMGFPVEDMNPMAALRLGTNLMRQEFTYADYELDLPAGTQAIGADEDSIPMETEPTGTPHAVYEFTPKEHKERNIPKDNLSGASGLDSCYHLVAGVPTIAAAISRIRQGHLPLEPKPELSCAANYLYMLTGDVPTPEQERVMDIALILHADHGMNASTFATLVVASTLSDIYFSVGSGIAALNGPLHGGANEQAVTMLTEIGGPENVAEWYQKARAAKQKIVGFGHRVYKTYDPRARVLGPLAKLLGADCPEMTNLMATAKALEKEVVKTLGEEKGIYPNVDFYSGMVYRGMGIPTESFTPTFAVARVAGWTARVHEYLKKNRIFRPRALYVGPLDRRYVPVEERTFSG